MFERKLIKVCNPFFFQNLLVLEGKKNNVPDDDLKTIMVACYRKPYDEKSLKSIKKLIRKEKPDRILVLNISETKESSGTVESYLGRKDVEKLRDQYKKDQRIRSQAYTDKISDIADDLDIPIKEIKKKGKAAEIILNVMKKYDPYKIIIHSSDKSSVDKLISGSVKEEVCKKSSCEVEALK
ncbi:MAG: universal stress protein [Candidatus Thermoplasmatota archaeon]